MCDYSLHAVASRPAKVGDKLVTTKFWNTTTRGFSSTGEPKVAVCLVPGTEVVFEDQVEREPIGFLLSLFKRHSQTIVHKVARFRQINLENLSTHHDALEFPDGQIVLLTHLRVGQRATVLQLPVQGKTRIETKEAITSRLLTLTYHQSSKPHKQRQLFGRVPGWVSLAGSYWG